MKTELCILLYTWGDKIFSDLYCLIFFNLHLYTLVLCTVSCIKFFVKFIETVLILMQILYMYRYLPFLAVCEIFWKNYFTNKTIHTEHLENWIWLNVPKYITVLILVILVSTISRNWDMKKKIWSYWYYNNVQQSHFIIEKFF